jgi:hypothetical protein
LPARVGSSSKRVPISMLVTSRDTCSAWVQTPAAELPALRENHAAGVAVANLDLGGLLCQAGCRFE